MAKAGHMAKPKVREQEQKSWQPFERGEERSHVADGMDTGKKEERGPVMPVQAKSCTRASHCLPSSPASSSAPASSALGQNLEETLSSHMRSPWRPHSHFATSGPALGSR